MTDSAYVGTDFDLGELVDAQTLDETRSALRGVAHRVASWRQGGAHAVVTVALPRPGPATANSPAMSISSSRRAACALGVCDWGYCVYRVESAACAWGTERGPNPLWRTESTCMSCANFAVTERHRPVWQARLDRNIALVADDRLDCIEHRSPPERALPSASVSFPIFPLQEKPMPKMTAAKPT